MVWPLIYWSNDTSVYCTLVCADSLLAERSQTSTFIERIADIVSQTSFLYTDWAADPKVCLSAQSRNAFAMPVRCSAPLFASVGAVGSDDSVVPLARLRLSIGSGLHSRDTSVRNCFLTDIDLIIFELCFRKTLMFTLLDLIIKKFNSIAKYNKCIIISGVDSKHTFDEFAAHCLTLSHIVHQWGLYGDPSH